MDLLNYRTLDGNDCFINPRRVTLVVAQGTGCRIHLGAADHFVEVDVPADRVAAEVGDGAEPPAPADPTLNLLS
ncbi:hypothetical protein [Indioceanicola profundi]|uniref:hypothetical protein n=1 Tax=Indioceanicola profundi TaxID=2220096 RepID=UPI000E6AC98B|nr:hypothetical protein [Indioceanicola profundi]